jgi:predicted nucleic acid-binding protein
MPAYLLDTNVLLRLADPSAQGHDVAGRAVSQLLARNEPCFLTPQVLIEFWAVATRPAIANGLGWDAARARLEIDRLLDQFPLLEDIPAVFYHWLALVTSHNLSGKRVHDARLIAVMEAHQVTHLLTFNVADFPSAAGISIVHPRAVTIAK